MTALKAIRAKCLDCCCGSSHEVKLCPCPDCPLHSFRFGHNPKVQREVTPAQLEALKKARLSRKRPDKIKAPAIEDVSEGNYTPVEEQAHEAR